MKSQNMSCFIWSLNAGLNVVLFCLISFVVAKMSDDEESWFNLSFWDFYSPRPRRKEPAWERDIKISKKKEEDLVTGKLVTWVIHKRTT